MKRLMTCLVVFGYVTQAGAEGYVRAQAMYLSGGSGNGSITTKQTRTLADFGGGWVHSSGLTLGALYGTEAETNVGSPVSNRSSFGPTLGWMQPGDQGPFVLGTYFVTSTWDQYKGTGYQVDLGYRIPIGKVALAVELAYKFYKYNEISGASVDPAYLQEYFDPYFAFVVSL